MEQFKEYVNVYYPAVTDQQISTVINDTSKVIIIGAVDTITLHSLSANVVVVDSKFAEDYNYPQKSIVSFIDW